MDSDVIVIGAGPAGLTLAAELRLGGADVTVFEQRAERSWESRGIGFTARATEMFHQRGLLGRLENIEITRQGHFGGIPIDYGMLEGSHFGVRGAPQYKIEEMLENRALELGATLRRGYGFTGLTDTGDGVTATVRGPEGPEECTARYLVGCDGGRSTVRRLAGFEFAGSDATREMYLADVRGCDIKPRMIGELLPNGMVMAAPLEQGYTRIIVCEVKTPGKLGSRRHINLPGTRLNLERSLKLDGRKVHVVYEAAAERYRPVPPEQRQDPVGIGGPTELGHLVYPTRRVSVGPTRTGEGT